MWDPGNLKSRRIFEDTEMSIIFQLALLVLVLYSLVMVVAVPVLYSSAVDGSRSKPIILLGSLIWFGMIVAVATLNFLK